MPEAPVILECWLSALTDSRERRVGWARLGSQEDFLVLDLGLGSRVEFAFVGRGGEWLGQNPGCGSESLRVLVRGTGASDSNASLNAPPRRWG